MDSDKILIEVPGPGEVERWAMLRMPAADDLPFFFKVETDPLNRIFSAGLPTPSIEELELLISQPFDLISDKQSRWILQVNDQVVGLADLYDADINSSQVWIGIFIEMTFRRGGIGSACIKLLERKAAEAGFFLINALVDPLNFPALSLFRSCGYQPCATGSINRFITLNKQIG